MPERATILLVEDDADTRANMRDILELDGHRVTVAATAREARELMGLTGLCVVILDRRLPDGSAEELLPEFKNLLPRADIVVVTGFADLNSTITALQQGAADYIIKPVNPDALRGSLHRILERRRVQHELHAQHQLSDQILRTAEAVVLVLDLDGNIVQSNPYLSRVTGWKSEELLGKDWFKTCLPASDAEWVRELFHRTATDIETSGTVNPILTKDGRLRQIRWSNTTLKSEDGRPTSVLAVGVDVTDLFLAQERSLRAERLAAIGQTMTALAHESRNALQRIQASTEMLKLDLGSHPETHRDLTAIERAADDLQGLLEEVRSFAAPIVLDCSECPLSGIWQRAWQHLEHARRQRDATIVEHIDDVNLNVFVDSTRLQQVFRNLFENSLSACADPVRIEIRCNETDDQNSLQVMISDNGPGLSPDQHERIFDAFFTTKTTGTGLGMAIVQRIVEAHDGTIRTVPDSDLGAAFVMTFPRKEPL